MKKILLLGGSAQQIVAIETAKKLGYYTVVCDYLVDNPGQHVADKFYLVSTTDKDNILQIAIDEKIDGILAYASDPAAPTAAYVAEKLQLKTNPYESVQILCNKDKFRTFLSLNGFNSPMACGYANVEDAKRDSSKYRLPIIVKPVDSSGSKGATVVYDLKDLDMAIEFAFSFSRSHRIIIEEFIEKKHKYLIGGDVFIQDGKVVLWGLLNCHRDASVNPLVPVGKSYPLELEYTDTDNIKMMIQCMVEKLNIQSGAMNVELIVDKNNRVWPIDMGPRNGGNMIPDLLSIIFNIDIVELTVKLAMGEHIECQANAGEMCYATHNLHSDRNGIFRGISFSPEIEKHLIKKVIYKKCGDKVEYFDNASKALGIIFFKFENKDEMSKILEKISNYIKIDIR